jgi:hypothetical protein
VAEPRRLRTLREQIAARCVHFTGTQHDECGAGVNYRALAGGDVLCRIPCLNDEFWAQKAAEHGGFIECPSLHLPTPAEVEAEAQEDERHFAEFAAHLKAGECPTCKSKVKMRQVGPCVYGDCGHRLYQGKLPK